MKAFGKNLIVKRSETPTVSPGGITPPESIIEKSRCRGTVVSVGNIEGIVEGDEVIFAQCRELKIDGVDENLIVVGQDDVLAVL